MPDTLYPLTVHLTAARLKAVQHEFGTDPTEKFQAFVDGQADTYWGLKLKAAENEMRLKALDAKPEVAAVVDAAVVEFKAELKAEADAKAAEELAAAEAKAEAEAAQVIEK